MNGVIYARYSCEGQREESIEGQLRECMAFAQSKGITILKTYIDRAISGKNADNRPQFQQMIKDSAKKMFDVVLVWKLDRFARSRADSATYKCILKKRKILGSRTRSNVGGAALDLCVYQPLTKFPISVATNVPTAKAVMAVALCGCWIWSGLSLMKWCIKCTSSKR